MVRPDLCCAVLLCAVMRCVVLEMVDSSTCACTRLHTADNIAAPMLGQSNSAIVMSVSRAEVSEALVTRTDSSMSSAKQQSNAGISGGIGRGGRNKFAVESK